jgi:hypothetical protein
VPVAVALEVGKTRVFASALDWPGWSRSGRDEDAALASLLAYGPRYAAVMAGHVRGFRPPKTLAGLEVVERMRGDGSTDFGAPGQAAAAEGEPVTARELARLEAILHACWLAFDAIADHADGVALRTGPRGGGRELEAIREHTNGAHGSSYVRALGGAGPASGCIEEQRADFIEALRARAHGEVPDRGPRGGTRWSPRYAVRRAAWHILDHAWEIEDRAAK